MSWLPVSDAEIPSQSIYLQGAFSLGAEVRPTNVKIIVKITLIVGREE